ncbi:Ger(x)C family spore germination protein [Alteribacillus sp. HJP-4]|uniref:Ger(x)C family spore germination protein n=1 Tax=Alteribacillus sp. HJP-4 TaxID=2775394 RepID=UPI0035CCFC89
MANRYSVVSLLLTIAIVILTGCWNNNELDDFAIVTALGIDQTEDAERIEVTIEVANPMEIAGRQDTATGSGATTTLYSAEGDTLISAIRRISQQTPREAFFPYTQTIIFGEELAKNGIKELFDYLERDQGFRSTPRVLIARDTTAKEVISILSPLEKIPAQKLVNIGEVSGRTLGETMPVKIMEFIEKITSEGVEPIVSGVSVTGAPLKGTGTSNIEDTTPHALLKSEGLAIFKDGQLERWVDKEEARGVLFAINKIDSTIIDLDCNQEANAISFNISNTHSSIKATINNKMPTMTIYVKQVGEIEEIHCNADLTNPETINKFKKQMEEKTKQEIERAVQIAKEENSDVFGFGQVINREDPKKWREIKQEYKDKFPEIDVRVKVDAYVIRTGMRRESYNQD